MTLLQFVQYARKFLVALTAALAILAVALSDGVVTQSEIIQIVLAFLGSLGVYSIKNKEL